MGLTKNTDYAGDTAARLVEKLKRDSHSNFLATFAAELQEFETAAFEVLLDRWLETAEGVQLDGLGQIIGRERLGTDDDTYRLLLKAQILINLSSGTIPQILEIIPKVIPAISLEFVSEFPAGFTLVADDEPLDAGVGPIIADILTSATAGGVRGLFQYFETVPHFRFDGSGGSQFDGGFFFGTTIEG